MPSATGTSSATRLKLVVRRLPPGLTQEEFEASLGDEWRVGSGRVDWAVYKSGKVSKDPSKPSRPSRAYLNLTKQEYTDPFSDTVRNTKFNDAKATWKDPILLGSPTVEYAPFPRTPNPRLRKDTRQGTIDQDPDFIEFLESLTNPVPKTSTVDQRAGLDGKSKEKVTTTPLIQFLKDKKANKGKEAATAAATPKGAKHAKQPSKDAQPIANSSSDKKTSSKTTTSTAQAPDKRSAQAIMVEKAARDAARVLNKQVTTPPKPQAPTSPAAAPVTPPTTPANAPLAEKKRERGSASAAASILRRDLGIGTTPGSRGGRRGLPAGRSKPSSSNPAQSSSTGPTQEGAAKATDNSIITPSATPSAGSPSTGSTNITSTALAIPSQPPQTLQPPTGPAASRGSSKSNASPSVAQTPNAPSTPSKSTLITPTATQAFLKHANPSQGVTEPLLNEAFAAFGAVKNVEIDKKKGSAYVDFEEPEGLQKAIKASPIKVAQGQVVVLERRIGPSVQGRNVRGGPMMNNRGVPDARGGMMNHRGRGGMVNNRGGGIPMGPMGGRGGSMRGRGGFARGSANVHTTRPAATAAPQSTQANSTIISTAATTDVKPVASGGESAEFRGPAPAERTAAAGESA
ncbi:MAG: hypothetical protein Q9166_002749 [cf. Caloplaca sp. 2 TL-2023]